MSDAAFAGLVLLLREIAHGLLRERRPVEARGIIDGIAALQAKTKGNLLDEEDRFLSDVIYELQMAAVKAADAASAEAGPGPEPDAPESP